MYIASFFPLTTLKIKLLFYEDSELESQALYISCEHQRWAGQIISMDIKSHSNHSEEIIVILIKHGGGNTGFFFNFFFSDFETEIEICQFWDKLLL